MTTRLRAGAVLACLALMPLSAALAQPTNLEAYQRLALRCLAEAPDTTQAFWLDASAQMPYLRTALAQRWREQGRVLFLADTTQAFWLDAPAQVPYLRTALAQREQGRALFLADSLQHVSSPAIAWLRYEIEEAQVAYARAPGKQLVRTVTLALRYTFTAADGRLLREDRCHDTFTDTIRRSDRAALEWHVFPETQGEGSWIRRHLEPAIVAVATAVTVYLFFNIRSQRTDDGG